MAFHLDGYGVVDESVDVWALFQADARGELGLYHGQLVRELTERLPALAGRVHDAIRRGLASDDAREREAALHGAAQIGVTDVADALEQISVKHESGATSRLFFDVLAAHWQAPVAQRILARVAALPVAAEAEEARARALVAIAPDDVAEALTDAAARGEAPRARALVGALAASPSFDGAMLRVREAPEASRTLIVEAARDALQATTSAHGYDRWVSLAGALAALPPELPPRPSESDASQQFSARLAALMAAESAPQPSAPASLPDMVVLSREVWVDALLVPSGPPAELFSLLRARGVPVLVSDELVDDIAQLLFVRGWSSAQTAAAAERIRALSTRAGATGAEDQLANDAGVLTVYAVGPRTGTMHGAIQFRPVSELLGILQR